MASRVETQEKPASPSDNLIITNHFKCSGDRSVGTKGVRNRNPGVLPAAMSGQYNFGGLKINIYV